MLVWKMFIHIPQSRPISEPFDSCLQLALFISNRNSSERRSWLQMLHLLSGNHPPYLLTFMESLHQSSSVDCKIMANTCEWTMDPTTSSVMQEVMNFWACHRGLKPYFLFPWIWQLSTLFTTITDVCGVSPMNLLEILICSRHQQARRVTPRRTRRN
jgi:hypothetical protein